MEFCLTLIFQSLSQKFLGGRERNKSEYLFTVAALVRARQFSCPAVCNRSRTDFSRALTSAATTANTFQFALISALPSFRPGRVRRALQTGCRAGPRIP